MYDNAFNVDSKQWGTFTSYDAEGKALITSLTEESCVAATRWYLQSLQEGGFSDNVTYEGQVGGKL